MGWKEKVEGKHLGKRLNSYFGFLTMKHRHTRDCCIHIEHAMNTPHVGHTRDMPGIHGGTQDGDFYKF